MSPAESHLTLVDSVVHSAERLCEDELCCLRHRRKVSALCLFYKVYHRANHSLHFVAACNTRDLAALYELALVIPRCNSNQLCRSFLPAALRL